MNPVNEMSNQKRAKIAIAMDPCAWQYARLL